MTFADKQGVSHSLMVWSKDKYWCMMPLFVSATQKCYFVTIVAKGCRANAKIPSFARQKS